MKKHVGRISGATLALLATTGLGQDLVITSFQGNGQLSWTNAANLNGHCRVEWAAAAGGPWFRSFQSLQTIDVLSNRSSAVSVPMFYRVTMTTNPPPRGMVWVDGGNVELGDVRTNEFFADDSGPVHTNFISGFWMDEMEVTKAKWVEVYNWARTNGYTFENAGTGKAANHPVHTVNWYDCLKWCNARSAKEGLLPVYYYLSGTPPFQLIMEYKTGQIDIQNGWVVWSASGYRLPTEAEWEKAARGGRQRRLFPWGGDTIQQTWANYYAVTSGATTSYDKNPTEGYHATYNDYNWPYTSPAGSFPANGYGLHDVAGNVGEWCWDWYGPYSASYATDPRGPATIVGTPYRVVRGGDFQTSAGPARCADRSIRPPSNEYSDSGFRCVKGP